MVNNPRFPHKVEIYRMALDEYGNPYVNPNTGEEEPMMVYSSECGLRDMVRGKDIDANVIKADYKLALPYNKDVDVPIIYTRDEVKFTHALNGQVILGEVEDFKAYNLGMNIWFQSNSNKHGE
jgi:hypothetical protein